MPESKLTKGVDEAFPTAGERQEWRRREYLAENRDSPGTRAHDAEQKILDSASAQLAQNPTAEGERHPMPNDPPCPACTAAIHAFGGDHPIVKVFLLDKLNSAQLGGIKAGGQFRLTGELFMSPSC